MEIFGIVNFCGLEALHFVPMVLLLIGFITREYSSSASFLGAIILSVAGLFGGHHAHVDHLRPLAWVDPCYLYMVVIAVSAFCIARNVVLVRARSNAK